MKHRVARFVVGLGMIGVVVGIFGGFTRRCAAEEPCHAAPPSPRQEYRQEKQTQIQQLQTQLKTLQAQLKSTTEANAKVQLRTQINNLEKQQCDLMIDLTQHQVDWDKEDVAAAQQRLAKAEVHLTELQAKEAAMESKTP